MNPDHLQQQATNELQQLGLSAEEAQYFSALGRLSSATIDEIAPLTDVPANQATETLATLQDLGLVDIEAADPPRYRAVEPELVERKLRREQEYRVDSVAGVFDELEPYEKDRESNHAWTIKGRRNTIDRGQWLIEQADEELFMMFTLNDLVLDGCIDRIRDALDRGASVSVGTHNDTLRERINDQAPEVLVWEPEHDWLGLPVADGGMLGRLLMVDREMVMIGSLMDENGGPDGPHRETAVWSRGTSSGLVTTVCNIIRNRADVLRDADPDAVDELAL